MNLYHVSKHYHGETVRFEPRVPRAPARGEDFTTPRICVAATIGQCLAGITKRRCEPVMYVYRAVRPRGIDWDSPRYYVPDWEETEEVWIKEPCEFKLVCMVFVEWPGEWVPRFRKRALAERFR